MANQGLKKLNYQIGRICRIGSRKLKLMAVNNRRKQQLRHLGERIYILKTLQQDDNIWDKDEIAQLLLTIADLDQEIEMIIDEINEIKAETSPDEAPAAPVEEAPPAPETPAADDKPAAAESEEKPAAAKAPEAKETSKTKEAPEAKEAKKPARKAETKASKKKPAAKSGQKSKATTKKSTTKSEKADK